MAEMDSSNLPDGVSLVGSDWNRSSTIYQGTDEALIAGGIARPEWLEDMGGWTKTIVLEGGDKFSVVRDGKTSKKGSCVNAERRNKGLISILRLRSGELEVSKFHTLEEKRRLDEEAEARYQAERDAERRQGEDKKTWATAKEVRSEVDFLAKWKVCVLRELEGISKLADGRIGYEGFPDIKLSHRSLGRVQSAIAALQEEITAASPMVDDLRVETNVIYLRKSAYRYMAKNN